MKRFTSSLLIAGLLASAAWAALNRDPNADAPVITTLLEQRDGSQIKLSFLAIRWNPDVMNALPDSKEMRDYYNTYFAAKMGVLETNIKLKFGGKHQIGPGVYYLGIKINEPPAEDQSPYWSLILSDQLTVLASLPIKMNEEDSIQEHLSFVFMPGLTNRDFVFHMRYGSMSTSMRWTITGIPSVLFGSPPPGNPFWNEEKEDIKDSISPSAIQQATSTPKAK
ncbi:MAG: hypothetical protein JXR73_21210 [Candidatus Omnitrophica bacterium]|nr:hypothetical protein [Candidatus Omnitrophota bacterium]